MKLTKRISCVVLALMMTLAVFSVSTPVSAATKAEKRAVPAKVRIYPQSYNNFAIEFDYDNVGDQIKNLNTSSKNLVAKQTYQHSESATYTSPENYARIGLYAKKTGKYTVSFDIYSKDGKVKRSSKKVTVYVKDDSPVKSVAFAGKTIFTSTPSASNVSHVSYTNKKSGKISIKMSKGYTLKKIQIRTYDKNGNAVVKTVKNNKKIILGQYGSGYSNEYQSSYNEDYWYSYWYSNIEAATDIIVTYKDKWSKQDVTRSYCIYRLAK